PTGKLTKTLSFPGPKDHGSTWAGPGARCLAYSPDGKILALGIVNGHVILFSSETFEQLSDVPVGESIGALAFDPADGMLCAADKSSNLSILRSVGKSQWSKVGSVQLGPDNEVHL